MGKIASALNYFADAVTSTRLLPASCSCFLCWWCLGVLHPPDSERVFCCHAVIVHLVGRC